jgi:hypothetical protein
MDIAATENRAALSRTTVGRSKYYGTDAGAYELWQRYLRDVHGPAIARRAGVFSYRRYDFGPVVPDLFGAIEGIEQNQPDDRRLTGAGHLDYLDERALRAFYSSPRDERTRALLLEDLDVIGGGPGWTTTYRTLAGNAHTYVDTTETPAPQGSITRPWYGIFVSAGSSGDSFRAGMRGLAERWSQVAGVSRLRLHLFEAPDPGTEVRHGYRVSAAAPTGHYHAWIDLGFESELVAPTLMSGSDGVDLAPFISAIHVHPVQLIYTYVWAGRPTEVGLRGYSAYEVIERFGAKNQQDPGLLEWLYGPVVNGTLT